MNLKTKKIILLITSLLALIIDLAYAIAIYSGILHLEVVGDVNSISNTTQVILLCICGFANFIATLLIIKDLTIYKKRLIVLNIISLLFGNIINLIASIINIIILSKKTTDVEEVKEKKELPVLEDITKHKWYVYFIIFVFLFIICNTPVINLLPIPNTKIASITTIAILYGIQIVLLVIPMFNELKRDFVIFKNNFKLYLSKMLPRFGIIIIGYFICVSILTLFINELPTNQELINSLPIYISAFLAIIIAPLIEELMYRGFIKKFIKNDILFLILSSLIFGGLHVLLADSIQQFLFIIPYSILGFAFSLNYVKTKNIVSNIFLHSAWNSIAVISMILLKLS